MFGSVKGLPRFNNYQEAVEFARNTKGIRGREHIIPLKQNRRDPNSYRIEMDKHGVVSCVLYRTAVLQYFPDQLIINAYQSMTTNSFINEIAPRWLQAYMTSGQRFWVRGEGDFVAGKNDKVVIYVDENYEPIKGGVVAAKLEAIVLNKTRAAESRKKTKDVVELARVTSKIDGYWQALVDSKENIDDPTTEWLQGLLKVGFYRMWTSYRGEERHHIHGSYPKESTADLLPTLKKHLYQKQYAADECYDYVPAEYGVVPTMWRYAGGDDEVV